MKKMTKILAIACALMMVASCFVACGSAKKDQTYYIGATGPLTGDYSVYGKAVQNGAQMAIDEINATDTAVKFSFKMLDDKGDSSMIQSLNSTMMEEGMQVSLGAVLSGACLEFKEFSKSENIFFMAASASNDQVPEYANGYQMCFADGNQGSAAAAYVNENMKGQTIGVLYRSDDAYSTGILTQFEAALDSSITLVKASFQGDKVASFDSQVDILKGCKFIFMPIYYTPASQFMTAAVGKVADDAVYYGCDGLDGINGGVDGFSVYDIPQEISYLTHFTSKATEGAAKEFVDKYNAKYGEIPNQFAASAYDCVYAIHAALEKAGDSVNASMSASEICEILKGIINGGFTFSGVTGTNITWQSNGFVQKVATKEIVKSVGEKAPQ